jgi:Tfp pilus assembly protein PilN
MSSQTALESMEVRLGQLIQAVDEQRRAQSQFLFGMSLLLATGIVVATTYSLYKTYTRDLTPPQLQSYLPVPVKIGDHRALLGLQVVDWQLPPELNAIVQEEARLRLEAEQKARQEAEAKAKAAAATQSSNSAGASEAKTPPKP